MAVKDCRICKHFPVPTHEEPCKSCGITSSIVLVDTPEYHPNFEYEPAFDVDNVGGKI